MIEKVIILDKDILLYDVENVVSKVSQSRLREDNLEQCIQMQADETDQDREVTRRSVDKHVNIVRSKIGAYVKDDADGSVIRLQFPDGWKQVVFLDLTSSVHDYIVNMSVCEWFNITDPREASVYREIAGECLDRIKSCVTARIAGSVYRPLHPF